MLKIMELSHKTRELFGFTPLQYMIQAIYENPSLADIYVDNKEDTKLCMVLFGHYLFIAGDVRAQAIQFLNLELLTEELRKKLEVLIIFYPDKKWKKIFVESFSSKIKVYERSLYFKSTHGVEKYEKKEGVTQVNEELMNSEIKNLNMITEEIVGTATYNGMKDFYERGIGYTLIKDKQVCGFCTSEYPTKESVAIGIEVAEGYKEQGYAKSMTLAFLTEAASRGLNVYWECWKYNVASANTAKSSGFEKLADYPILFLELNVT